MQIIFAGAAAVAMLALFDVARPDTTRSVLASGSVRLVDESFPQTPPGLLGDGGLASDESSDQAQQQEQLAMQEMLQSEQQAEEQNEAAEQQAQMDEQQGFKSSNKPTHSLVRKRDGVAERGCKQDRRTVLVCSLSSAPSTGACAPEYDHWWQRRGRYDHGPDDTAEWDRQVQAVVQALDTFGPAGDVLELAGGTGWWTQRLAQTAANLTVVDSSDETLRLNRERVDRPDGKGVTYIVADIFGAPDRRYDTVFFSFWLSHVPRQLFAGILGASGVVPTARGRVFLIDNRRDPTRAAQDPYIIDEADDVQRRRLTDGSEHRVVKVFYEPDELAKRLRRLGWVADVAATSRFIYGSAMKGFAPQ